MQALAADDKAASEPRIARVSCVEAYFSPSLGATSRFGLAVILSALRLFRLADIRLMQFDGLSTWFS